MEKTGPLDEFLESSKFDAFLTRDDSSNANLYYLTRFEAPDPMVYLRTERKSILLASPLEYSRAREEAEVDEIVNTSSFKDGDNRGDKNSQIELIERFLERYNVEKLAVPGDFSLKFAEKLRENGIEVSPIEDKVVEARKIKSGEEREKIRNSQQITEKAMKKAESMIEKAETRNGKLFLEGEPLTSERMKKKIRYFLIEQGCEVPEETIVSCGKESAKPHNTGTGALEPGGPIIVDIFPRHEKYFGDMTRTFVKGEAGEEVKEMKEAVLEAQKAAFEVLEEGAGITAEKVHSKVCDVLEDHGYNTLRNGDGESGFIHSTGHAVGLDLHEPPRIADNEDELKEGMILTIEPGLYLPEIGGTRIEDMVLVKEDGYENFNSMHKCLET